MEVSKGGVMKFLIADDHPLVRRALRLTLDRVSPGATVLEADSLPSALALIEEYPDLDLFLMDLFMPGSNGLDGLQLARQSIPSSLPVAVVSADETLEMALGALECGVSGYLPKSLSEDVMRAALALILAGGVYVPPMIAERALRSGGALPSASAVSASRGGAAAGGSGAPSVSAVAAGPLGGSVIGSGGQAAAGGSSGFAASVGGRPAIPQTLYGRAALTPRQCEVLSLVIEGMSNKEIADRLLLAEATVKVHITAILRAYRVSNRSRAISAAQKEDLGG